MASFLRRHCSVQHCKSKGQQGGLKESGSDNVMIWPETMMIILAKYMVVMLVDGMLNGSVCALAGCGKYTDKSVSLDT